MKLMSFILTGLMLLTTGAALARDYTPKECKVVGNTNSMIYHTQGGQFYDRMLKENARGDNRQCFKTTSAAQSAGFRASKR